MELTALCQGIRLQEEARRAAATQLTRMPEGASSMARERVRPMRAALVAE